MRALRFFLLFLVVPLHNSCNSQPSPAKGEEVIFKDDQGNKILRVDLEGATGVYNWEIKSDMDISEEAVGLHQAARAHGGKGEYAEAIEKLMEAHALAPNWAYPVYDLAYTYLLQKDFANALKYYEETDILEPKGFFTAKTAYWSLKKEAEGVFDPGLYLAFTQLEWMNADADRVEVAKAIVDKFPTYAPAWKVIAEKAVDNEERLQAIERGLAAAPDEQTKGGLLINKALIKNLQGVPEEAKTILGALIFAQGATNNNIELAKYVLSTITEED